MSSGFVLRERLAPERHPDVSAAAHLGSRGLRVAALTPHTCVNSLFALQPVLPAPAGQRLPSNETDRPAGGACFGSSAR